MEEIVITLIKVIQLFRISMTLIRSLMSEERMYFKFLIFPAKANMAFKHIVNLRGIIILLK